MSFSFAVPDQQIVTQGTAERILRYFMFLCKSAEMEKLNGIKVRVFFEKKASKKNTCAAIVRIIITFTNQIFL